MYINLLTQLKNAQAVKKETIKTPYSKNDEIILDILAKNKFIDSFEKKGRGVKKFLSIDLKYDKERSGAIRGMKILSTPSRHIYSSYQNIKSVKSGYGLLVISTPKGIITGREAKKKKSGGELFFEIW